MVVNRTDELSEQIITFGLAVNKAVSNRDQAGVRAAFATLRSYLAVLEVQILADAKERPTSEPVFTR